MHTIPAPPYPRNDGWTPDRQAQFLEALADCGMVAEAAKRVGMSRQSAYQLRRQPAAADFAAGWDAALVDGWRRVEETAMERALGGETEVIDRDGVTITRHRPCSSQLMIVMLDRAERIRTAAKVAAASVDRQMIGRIRDTIKALSEIDPADQAEWMAIMDRRDARMGNRFGNAGGDGVDVADGDVDGGGDSLATAAHVGAEDAVAPMGAEDAPGPDDADATPAATPAVQDPETCQVRQVRQRARRGSRETADHNADRCDDDPGATGVSAPGPGTGASPHATRQMARSCGSMLRLPSRNSAPSGAGAVTATAP